jgi:hypothetical protein
MWRTLVRFRSPGYILLMYFLKMDRASHSNERWATFRSLWHRCLLGDEQHHDPN